MHTKISHFKKRFSFLFISLLTLGAVFSFTFIAYAVSYSGFAWGGTQGPNGASDAYQGIGWISANSDDVEGGAFAYNLEIPLTPGTLSGYMWSPYYGWLGFNEGDTAGCTPPLPPARRNADDTLSGGARFLAIRDALSSGNSGGYDGCVSLSGNNYGVSVNADGTLSGYMWSSDLGYINMEGVSPFGGVPPIGIPNPPTITILTPSAGRNIDNDIDFSFVATDPDGDDIQYLIDWNNDGSVDETSPTLSSGTAYMSDRMWNSEGTYTVRAQTRDEGGLLSPWATEDISIANPSAGSCSGTFPNATLCSGSDTGFGGTLSSTLVGYGGCNANVKCQYQCNSGYLRQGNTCVDPGGGPLPQ
jgi:hypothetical protein